MGDSERCVASLVLSGVADAIGYKNSDWEFNGSGVLIHNQLEELGGLQEIDIQGWAVSDVTVLSLAIAEGIAAGASTASSFDQLMEAVAKAYVACWGDMADRAPGNACTKGQKWLQDHPWPTTPFCATSTGSGAAIRAAPIGLRFVRPEERSLLIATAIECGRLTHTAPTGFLGSLVAATFTSFAISSGSEASIPVERWGQALLNEILPKARQYLIESGRDIDQNGDNGSLLLAVDGFAAKWDRYLTQRGIRTDRAQQFPAPFGPAERDAFYASLSTSGCAGSSGDDAVLVAYDALLFAGDNWSELLKAAALHGGDNNATGAIAAAWWGALHGFRGVPENHHRSLEFRERLEKAGHLLMQSRSQLLPFVNGPFHSWSNGCGSEPTPLQSSATAQ